jgi:hypothetical protein
MKTKSAKQKANAFATSVEQALKRAQASARKTARMHGTPIYFLRDGKVVAEKP